MIYQILLVFVLQFSDGRPSRKFNISVTNDSDNLSFDIINGLIQQYVNSEDGKAKLPEGAEMILDNVIRIGWATKPVVAKAPSIEANPEFEEVAEETNGNTETE